jgi:DNA-binding response OmpR family regulator
MDLLAVYPESPPPDLARTLDLGGFRWKAFGSAEEVTRAEPAEGWKAAIVCGQGSQDGSDLSGNQSSNQSGNQSGNQSSMDTAWAVCRALRKRDGAPVPLLMLVTGAQLDELSLRDDLFDDFCLLPFHPRELEARLRHLVAHETITIRPEVVDYGGLVLNLETYQALIEGQPLDLTFMEYELLKFLTQNPGRVFTREILLSRVWGYDYYGGARTVDVHIRRLRAKLGEEHANLIQTVRSVGYRFGQSRLGN